jgi:hypothetical protein
MITKESKPPTEANTESPDSLESSRHSKLAKRAPKIDPTNRLDGQIQRHRLINIPSTSKKERPSRDCKVCKLKKVRSSTKFICSACNILVHPGDCYTRYHTLKQY